MASVGGWFAIGASKLYSMGDRIRIGDTKGDVIDISILRTTVLETGNWVSGDLHNGRLARIPNSLVLKGPVFNYTQGFRFVWDEIKVTLTAQSDHRFARIMLLDIAQETVADFMEEAQHTWKDVKDDYRIENPGLEPLMSLAVNGGSLEFTVSYIVDYAQRTLMKDRLFTKIADEIANNQGRLEWGFFERFQFECLPGVIARGESLALASAALRGHAELHAGSKHAGDQGNALYGPADAG